MTNNLKVDAKGYKLKVAWLSGDDVFERAHDILGQQMKHLDAANDHVKLAKNTDNFLNDPDKAIVSCHAYMGARGITLALRNGADIVLCKSFTETIATQA